MLELYYTAFLMEAFLRLSLPKKVLLLAAVCTAGVYLPSVLSNEFVAHDDGLLIHQNPLVTEMTLGSVWGIFTSYDPELYVPLTLLSYKLEYLLFADNPIVYHFVNLLLHIACSLLIAGICTRLSKKEWVGVVCAVLFLLHPLNTEAVAWASSRKDLLSALFFFLAFSQYLKAGKSTPKEVVFYAAALSSKVSIILYPALLLLTDWYQGRRAYKEKVPHGVLAILFGAIALFGKRFQVHPLSVLDQLLIGAKGSVFYVQQLLWPTKLSLIHPQQYPLTEFSLLIFIPILLIVAAVVLRKKYPLFMYCTGAYFLMLLPTFATFWKNGWVVFASERYVYASLFAVFLLVCTLCSRLPSRVAAVLTVVVAVTLGSASYVQAKVWNNSIALYEKVLETYPQSTHALNNLGTSLYELSDAEGALAKYDQAIAIDDNRPQIHSNRGTVLLKMGNTAEAIQAFQNGIEVDVLPDTAFEVGKPYLLLAAEYDKQGQWSLVLPLLEQAVEVDPRNQEVHYNLAIQYQKREMNTQAEPHFLVAATHPPVKVDSLYRLAAVQAAQGKIPDAIKALKKVQRLSPGYQRTEEHLSVMKTMQLRR